MTSQPLPWSLREKLRARFRKVLFAGPVASALSDLLVKEVQAVLALPAPKELLAVFEGGIDGASLSSCFAEWLQEVPERGRAEWMLDRLAERAGFAWAPEPDDVAGPIELPARAWEIVTYEFQKLRAARDNCANDVPDFDEYVALMDHLLDRFGRENEALAARVLKRRYPDKRTGVPHTFLGLLASKPILVSRTSPRPVVDETRLLDFVTNKLDLRWNKPERAPETPPEEPPPPAAPPSSKEPKRYSPQARFEAGDLVDHPKFGRGTVTSVDGAKAKIAFPDGERTLLCAAR